MNQLIKYKAVYRTAPATPGLLNTRSNLEIDIENKLRNEVAVEITVPLTNIVNDCLQTQTWPRMWKYEKVTPLPKVSPVLEIKDLQKISGTSD